MIEYTGCIIEYVLNEKTKIEKLDNFLEEYVEEFLKICSEEFLR